MGGGAAIAPPPIPGSSQMKMQFVPASHGHNTLGTDVPRIIRHDGAKNRVSRVPVTRTGAADLDYEGNVYTEKRVMWETLSPATLYPVCPGTMYPVCPGSEGTLCRTARADRVNCTLSSRADRVQCGGSSFCLPQL